MADLPPVGTTAVTVEADSSALDDAFQRDIPRKAREGAAKAGQAFGQSLSSSIQARTKDIRQALEAGLINETEARDLAKRAARSFTTQFNRDLRALRKQGFDIDVVDEAKVRSEIRNLSNIVPAELGRVGRRGGQEMSQQLLQAMQGGFGGLRSLLAGTIAGAIAFAGLQAVRAATRLARQVAEAIRAGLERGSQVGQRREAFGFLAAAVGVDQNELLRTLRRETRLLVSDFDLLRQANFALQSGLPATSAQLGEMANIARRLARSVGRDATDAYDRLIGSIVKGERRVLDELGIVVSFTEANEVFAASIGRTTAELTEQERTQARLNAVLAAGRTRVRELGEETLTAGERLAQFSTLMSNLRDRTLELAVAAPATISFFESIGIAAENSADQIDGLAARMAAFIVTTGEAIASLRTILGRGLVGGLTGIAVNFPERFRENLSEIEAQIERDAERGRIQTLGLADAQRELAAVYAEALSGAAKTEEERNLLLTRQAALLQRIARLRVESADPDPDRDLQDVLRETKRLLEEIGDIEVSPGDLRPLAVRLKEFVDRLFPDIEARIQRSIAAGAPEAVRLRDFRREAEEVIASTDDLGQRMLRLQGVFQEYGTTVEGLPPFLREAAEAQGLLGDEIGDGGDKGDALAETLDDIERGARGLLRAADAAGVLSDGLRNALEGAVELSSAIRDISTNGANFGNVVQAVGAGVSILSGVASAFGDPEGDRQRAELIQALDRLRETIDRQAQAILDIPGRINIALNDVFDTARFAPSDTIQSVRDRAGRELELVRDPNEIIRRFREAGLTGDDIREIAARTDLDLTDLARAMDGVAGAGGRAADEIFALQRALDLESLQRFFQTFRGQLDLLQREIDILDLTPEEELDRVRQLFKDFNTGVGDDLLGQDLTTEAGRAEAERIIEEAFKAGITDPEALLALAGDLSPEEFLDLLGRFEALLDEQDGEVDTSSTQQGGAFKGVSIGQGDKFIALQQTAVAYLQDIAISARTLTGRSTDGPLFDPIQFGQPIGGPGSSGGTGPVVAPTPPPIPSNSTRLTSPSVSVSVSVGSVGPFEVTGPNADAVVAEAARRSVRSYSRALEAETRDQLKNMGVV